MLETIIELALFTVAGYALCGVVFTFVFHLVGLRRFDHGTHGTGWLFRLLITPGLIGLWPVLARKWQRAARGGDFAGSNDAPVNARQLRKLHRVWWQLLAVLVPLLIAAALYWRPSTASSIAPNIPAALQR